MATPPKTAKKINPSRLSMPTTKRIADLEGPDFFPTPDWATHALIDHEDFSGLIWEPACGDGAMAEILKTTGNEVLATDLFDRDYGQSGINFLEEDRHVDHIVTNPPFHSAQDFVSAGLRQTRGKLALLLRLAFLESANRYHEIFAPLPPARVWVFSERITFYPKDAERKGSGTTAYAWFVWDKAVQNDTKKPDETILKWLPPGYKKKYS